MVIFTSRKSRNKVGRVSLIIFRFLRFLRPYWLKGLFAFLFMLLGVGLQLPMPFLTKYLIDKVIVMKSFRILNIIGFVLIGVLFLRAVSIFIERYLLTTFRGRVLFDLRMSLFNHTERLKLSYLHNKETGYLMRPRAVLTGRQRGRW